MNDIESILENLKRQLEGETNLPLPSNDSYQIFLYLHEALKRNKEIIDNEMNKRNNQEQAAKYRGIVDLEVIVEIDDEGIPSPKNLERYNSFENYDDDENEMLPPKILIVKESEASNALLITDIASEYNSIFSNVVTYDSVSSLNGNLYDSASSLKEKNAIIRNEKESKEIPYDSFVKESLSDHSYSSTIKNENSSKEEIFYDSAMISNEFLFSTNNEEVIKYDSVESLNDHVYNSTISNEPSTNARKIKSSIGVISTSNSESLINNEIEIKNVTPLAIKSSSFLDILGKNDESVVGATGWNTRFLRIKRMPEASDEERMLKTTLMTELLVDFTHISHMFGKIIISEIFLPNEKKTIKMKSIGGIAGGFKYIVGGILFKLAVDNAEKAIYQADSELAAKAASHDLKGLTNIYEAIKNLDNVCVPLQCLIDYRGFRLVAMTILPLNKEIPKTPLMGTSDCGLTIHADDENLMKIVSSVAETLNLRDHIVGEKKLYFGCDVEGHLGEDSVYYFLDFARTFPPEHPLATKHLPKVKDYMSIFYRMLRPEFVRSYHKKLNPDACSRFGMNDPEFALHMKDLKEATDELLFKIIPAYCEELINRGNSGNYSFSKNMHQYGINIRHIGLVRNNTMQSYNATTNLLNALLVEIVSRVLKNMLRHEYRKLLKRTMYVAESSFIETTIQFLNLVSGSCEDSQFWTRVVPQEIEKRYGKVALSEKEKSNLFHHVSPFLYDIFLSTFLMLCLQLTSISLKQLKKTPLFFNFVAGDVKSISPRVKTMYLMGEANGLMLSLQASKIISEWSNLKLDSSIESTASLYDFETNFAIKMKAKKETLSRTRSANSFEFAENTESLELLSAESREIERLLTLSNEFLSSAYTSFAADINLLVIRGKDLIRLALLPHIGASKRTNLLEASAQVFKMLPLYHQTVLFAIQCLHRRLGLKQITPRSSIESTINMQKAKTPSEIASVLNLVSCENLVFDQKLGFEQIEKFFTALKYNGSLDSLSLAGNALTKGGGIFCTSVLELSDALKVNSVLVHLNVSNCKLNSNGASVLASGLLNNNSLAYLNVSKNIISGDGGIALGFALSSNKGLRCLDISENSLGDDGMESFSESLTTNTTLICLNLAKNLIYGYSEKDLLNSLNKNYSLTFLDLNSNGFYNMSKALLMNSLIEVKG